VSAEATSRSLGTAHDGLPFWDNRICSSYLILSHLVLWDGWRLEINHVSDFSDNLTDIQTVLATTYLSNSGQEFFTLCTHKTPHLACCQKSRELRSLSFNLSEECLVVCIILPVIQKRQISLQKAIHFCATHCQYYIRYATKLLPTRSSKLLLVSLQMMWQSANQ
jgi:hypothetical protein